jgi:hypothetical protein
VEKSIEGSWDSPTPTSKYSEDGLPKTLGTAHWGFAEAIHIILALILLSFLISGDLARPISYTIWSYL